MLVDLEDDYHAEEAAKLFFALYPEPLAMVEPGGRARSTAR